MADTQTIEFTGLIVEDGVSLGGVFFPTGNLQTVGSTNAIGLIYDFSSVVGTDQQVIAVPTRIGLMTHPDGPSATGITSSVYIVDSLNPPPYGASVVPGEEGEVSPEFLISQVTGDYKTGNLTWQADTVFHYVFGQRYSNGAWAADTTFELNWRRFVGRRVRNGGYSGRISFTLKTNHGLGKPWYYSNESASVAQRPTLELLTWGFHTGHADWPMDRGRSLHDMRSGLPAMAGELVEDGYNPGVWVRRDWWSDKDRRGERTDPVGEGIKRDKIPQ